ncbi:RZZ complex, subunit Zw10 [Corchorus olitorius]|uniref:RZZ complex, subunit Zw10 n=1 Tax=Corchorus olitorius TaxID=93759 RepID=A0A1R3KKM5_9ROSI|nr:RZZ complex, subunit Zw10 [Corchorus olitorius]
MDPLLDRINVRDLLSGHDLSDPSTPLSAPDLRLLINRLESHSLHIKSKVRSYILSHHDDFASLFSLCNDAVSKTNDISNNLSDILSLISDSPIDVEIRELIDEIGKKTKEAKEKRELLGLLRIIVGICQRLEGARSALRDGRLKFAAEEVEELKKALRIGDEEEGEPIVYGLLRKQWTDLFDEMQELLAKFMENAVQFEQNSRTIRVKYRLSVDQIDGIELHTVLEAMDVAGILGYSLAKAADLIIKHVITPAVNYGSPVTFIEDIDQGSEGIREAALKILPSQDGKVANWDGDAIYARVIQVVPEDASKLAEFQKIIKCTSEFEISLKEMMFISPSNSEEDRLSNFAENVEEYTTKTASLKNDGMAIYTSEQVVDLLFQSEKCVVSKAASQLMDLVHQTLKAARDAILLYEAVIPVKEILGLAFELQPGCFSASCSFIIDLMFSTSFQLPASAFIFDNSTMLEVF